MEQFLILLHAFIDSLGLTTCKDVQRALRIKNHDFKENNSFSRKKKTLQEDADTAEDIFLKTRKAPVERCRHGRRILRNFLKDKPAGRCRQDEKLKMTFLRKRAPAGRCRHGKRHFSRSPGREVRTGQ